MNPQSPAERLAAIKEFYSNEYNSGEEDLVWVAEQLEMAWKRIEKLEEALRWYATDVENNRARKALEE